MNAPMVRSCLTVVMALVLILYFQTLLAAGPVPLTILGAPNHLEPVNARAMINDCNRIGAVTFADGVFQIEVEGTICFIPLDGLFSHDFTLGRLPQGEYRMRLVTRNAQGIVSLSDDVVFGIAPPPARMHPDDVRGLADYSGIWWDPERSGDSIFIQHQTGSDKLLIVWNTFREDGQPHWFAALSSEAQDRVYDANIYSPSRSGLQRVGTARFVGDARSWPVGAREAALIIEIDGQGESRILELDRFFAR